MCASSETNGLLRRRSASRSRQSFLRRDRDAIHFAVRMAVCLTTASLFVLLPRPGAAHGFPQGVWVIITTILVCWFPDMDVASVVQKSALRLCGTLAGALIGLACGFASLEVAEAKGARAQAAFLAGCVALVTFLVSLAAVRADARGARLVDKLNYAVILCLMTFAIALMPFYSPGGDGGQWRKSVYRVQDVAVGCVLGVGFSMAIFPRPTVYIIQDKVARQIELAGEASEAVLQTAAETFAQKAYVPLSLAEEILEESPGAPGQGLRRMPSATRPWRRGAGAADLGHDAVLEKYDAAMKGLQAAKSQLGMLKFDPFNVGRPNDLLQSFRTEVAQTLARAMRIQTTVVLIDGIVRNDPKHEFSERHLELLAGVGALIRGMLTVPLDAGASDGFAEQLSIRLVAMRRMIVDLSATVSSTPELQIPSIIPRQSLVKDGINKSSDDLVGMYGGTGMKVVGSGINLADGELEDDFGGAGAPEHVPGSHVCSLLFLQLAEHLALRAVRLYQSWKQYEALVERAEALQKNAGVA